MGKSGIKITLIISFIIVVSVTSAEEIKLSSPSYKGKISVEEAIFSRRSYRRFKNQELTLSQVSQLLWSAGGVTIDGLTGATRAYPSAGGIYPLEIYLVAGNVKNLTPGIYKYNYKNHSLKLIKSGDFREELTVACYNQYFISQAPISIVWSAIYPRTTRYYGERGRMRYVPMDLGHSAQNVSLQAESLGLGSVAVGAFNDDTVRKILNLSSEETPLYIIPVGHPAR